MMMMISCNMILTHMKNTMMICKSRVRASRHKAGQKQQQKKTVVGDIRYQMPLLKKPKKKRKPGISIRARFILFTMGDAVEGRVSCRQIKDSHILPLNDLTPYSTSYVHTVEHHAHMYVEYILYLG